MKYNESSIILSKSLLVVNFLCKTNYFFHILLSGWLLSSCGLWLPKGAYVEKEQGQKILLFIIIIDMDVFLNETETTTYNIKLNYRIHTCLLPFLTFLFFSPALVFEAFTFLNIYHLCCFCCVLCRGCLTTFATYLLIIWLSAWFYDYIICVSTRFCLVTQVWRWLWLFT